MFEEGDVAQMLCQQTGLFLGELVEIVECLGDDLYRVKSVECEDGWQWVIHHDMIGEIDHAGSTVVQPGGTA